MKELKLTTKKVQVWKDFSMTLVPLDDAKQMVANGTCTIINEQAISFKRES